LESETKQVINVILAAVQQRKPYCYFSLFFFRYKYVWFKDFHIKL